MNRFPLLTTYYTLLIILAVLVLLGGIWVANDAATTETWRGETEFKFGTFLGTFLGFGAVAFGLAVSAEVIGLFLTMEEHLYEMRASLSRLPDSARQSMPTAPQTPAQQPQTTAIYTPTKIGVTGPEAKSAVLRATVKPERVFIVGTPGARMDRANVKAVAKQNQVLNLIGRTDDCRWVRIEREFEAWVDAANLSIEGDISTLPVQYGPETKSAVLRGTVKPERTLIVGTPGVWMARAIATQNQALKLIGRTDDCKWVQVEREFEAWVEASDLSIEGDISILPVKYSSQG